MSTDAQFNAVRNEQRSSEAILWVLGNRRRYPVGITVKLRASRKVLAKSRTREF